MNSSVDNLFTLFSHVFLNIIILTKKFYRHKSADMKTFLSL